MSTYYRPIEPIPLQKIKDSVGLQDQEFTVVEDEDKTYFTCGGHCIHYATDNNDNVIDLFRYGGNHADKILDPLECEFGIGFVDEYEDEYDDYCHPDTGVIQINFSDLVEASKKQDL